MTRYWEMSGGNVFSPLEVFCRRCSQLSWHLCVHLALCLFDTRGNICVTNCGARLGDNQVSSLVTALPPALLLVLPLTWSVPKSSPFLAHIYGNFSVLSTKVAPCCATAACTAQAPQQPYKPLLIRAAAALPFSPSPAVTSWEKYFFPCKSWISASLSQESTCETFKEINALSRQCCDVLQLWTTMGRIWPPQASTGFLQAGRQRVFSGVPCRQS